MSHDKYTAARHLQDIVIKHFNSLDKWTKALRERTAPQQKMFMVFWVLTTMCLKVHEGNDQEKAQSVKKIPTPKTEVGKIN